MPYLQHLELSSGAHTRQHDNMECACRNIRSLTSLPASQSVLQTYSFGGLQEHQIALAQMSR